LDAVPDFPAMVVLDLTCIDFTTHNLESLANLSISVPKLLLRGCIAPSTSHLHVPVRAVEIMGSPMRPIDPGDILTALCLTSTLRAIRISPASLSTLAKLLPSSAESLSAVTAVELFSCGRDVDRLERDQPFQTDDEHLRSIDDLTCILGLFGALSSLSVDLNFSQYTHTPLPTNHVPTIPTCVLPLGVFAVDCSI
jgi:hypothetical protein